MAKIALLAGDGVGPEVTAEALKVLERAGKQYGFSRSELSDLAIGAFLHDFGKVVIEKLTSLPGDHDVENLVKEHPTFGYLIVRDSNNASPISCQIINQHHELQNGSGYPAGLEGENKSPVGRIKRKKGTIYRLAEIVTVANVYDNLVFNPYSEKQLSPTEAMKRILEGKKKLYNMDILSKLTKIVSAYPEASMVRIKRLVGGSHSNVLDSYLAVVAKNNEKNLQRPVIIVIKDKYGNKITPQVVDTSTAKIVDLELIL